MSQTNAYTQMDLDLQNEIKRQQAYNASEISLVDEKTRRELWQAVFFNELQTNTKTDRISLAAAKADESVVAYDKQFGGK